MVNVRQNKVYYILIDLMKIITYKVKEKSPRINQQTAPWSYLNSNLDKRYSIIDQHLARHFKNNVVGLLSPPPFLCSQIITPFSHLMLSANQERGLCI